TCARVAISQAAVPAEVEDSRRRIEALETEQQIIGREKAIGMDTEERESVTDGKLEQERTRLEQLTARWEVEKSLVEEVLQIQNKLKGLNGDDSDASSSDAPPATDESGQDESNTEQETTASDASSEESAEDLLKRLTKLKSELAALQEENPLILPSVDAQAIASVVGDWTGIPVGRMVKNEIETILNLSDTLAKRVIGQDHALKMISRRIQTSRANLDNPNKPIGVFMLCGPSGVGKTETGLTLAESLYGGEQNVITINMSEFQEAHTVSTLKGAPPGYVGYGEGGILTEAVRRKPYSVVLLDEVEKAHPDVHEIFFQVFDKGWMEDGEGRHIDFKNTLILLTSNVGTEMIDNLCKDPELMPETEAIAASLRDPLLKVFPAALLGRLVVIPYYPLSDEILAKVVRLQLGRIETRIQENHGIPLTYDDEVIKLIISRCTEVESGARMVDAILTNTLLPEVSRHLLIEKMEGRPIGKIHIGVENDEFSYNFS
ncbi:MAG: AAA family ATPase, partial [Candidatus Thiodiazotropha sp. (ex Cardiolucina cf. quadrata)]|nr:AAA family ATPase [Candidatus Thiodiazotropha sp. (ex Cardiolucina cf. quadrata)]